MKVCEEFIINSVIFCWYIILTAQLAQSCPPVNVEWLAAPSFTINAFPYSKALSKLNQLWFSLHFMFSKWFVLKVKIRFDSWKFFLRCEEIKVYVFCLACQDRGKGGGREVENWECLIKKSKIDDKLTESSLPYYLASQLSRTW